MASLPQLASCGQMHTVRGEILTRRLVLEMFAHVEMNTANACILHRIDHCVAGDYNSGSKFKRNTVPRSKHAVRRDLDIAEHYKAMADAWKGRGDIALGGDGFMFP